MYSNTTSLLNNIPVKSKVITFDEISSKISDYDIYKKYLGPFVIGRSMKSPFREDKTPSFGIFRSKDSGKLLYNDLASTDSGNVFQFVKKLKNIETYKEVLDLIAKDMSMSDSSVPSPMANNWKYVLPETKIAVVRKPFTKEDIAFWTSFGIKEDTLVKFKVSSISCFFVNNERRHINNGPGPMFAFKVFDKFKIYRPLAGKELKWRGNTSYFDIQGYEQLPEKGELLFFTKSLKDIMALHELGYNAVAPSSESSNVPEAVINKLKERFVRIVILYDRDRAGMTFTRKLAKEFGLDFFFINKKYLSKDISDLIRDSSTAVAKELIIRELSRKVKQ